MIEVFDGTFSSTSLRGTTTTLVESSGSRRIVILSGDSPATRPVKTLPEVVATTEARYWSETTLLGSTVASARSLKPNRPAAWVRSGPVAPPSPANRWQSTQRAAAKARCPFAKSRPFVADSEAFINSARVQSCPGPWGLGSSLTGAGFRAPDASTASRSESVAFS